MTYRDEIDRALGGAGIDAADVLPLVDDLDLMAEVSRRRLSHLACVIGAEDLAQARSLIGRGERTEALLVIERALPAAFAGSFVPHLPHRGHR